MSERPSTASTLQPGSTNFNSATVTVNRPATSGGGGGVGGVGGVGAGTGGGGGSSSGRGTPPPNENKRAVAPNASPRPKSKADIQTPCRNIVIYGYCRYQDKGCTFNHDTDPRKQQQTPTPSESLRWKLNVDSPTFTPASTKSILTSKTADAAPFTPSKPAGCYFPTPAEFSGESIQGIVYSDPGVSITAQLDPNGFLQAVEPQAYQGLQQGFESLGLDSTAGAANSMLGYSDYGTVPQVNPYAHNGGDLFYQQQSNFAQPLQYHLYAPIGPHKQTLDSNQRNIHHLFISDNLREELQRKSEASLQTLQSSIASSLYPLSFLFVSPSRGERKRHSYRRAKNVANKSKDVGLPQVDTYHSLVPLDMTNQKSTQIFGYPTWIYKAFSTGDGKTYALRRVEGSRHSAISRKIIALEAVVAHSYTPCLWNLGFRLRDPKDIMVVQRWKKVSNANLVTLYDAFTTTRFQDSSIIFVYAYHPLSKTLADEHFGQNPRYLPSRHPQGGSAVPEPVLWSYMVQIANALRTIHGNGLAARVVEPSKILLTGKMRVRLNCCGMMDVMHLDGQRNIQDYQQDDIVQFGRLILNIACSTLAAAHSPHKSLEYVAKYYSADVKNAIMYLMGFIQQPNIPPKSMDEFISKYAFSYMTNNLDNAFQYEDLLEAELCRELENARLVRLLSKFGFINERPEFDHDRNWSESGDRYFIKLFRDYIFHSVDEHGMPVVDMTHVLTCLNKLDAGADEKIMLVSRDEQNCFIVSYKEIKRAIDAAFMDLSKNQRR